MASLLFILVIGLVVVLLVLIGVRMMGPRNTPGPNAVPGQPGCGGCGYPTQGISNLTCPECGADLRKVGIAKPGDGGPGLAGCLLPLLSTILVFLLGVGGYTALYNIIPTYEEESTSFDLNPDSDAYSEVLIHTELTLVIPPDEAQQVYFFDLQTNYGTPNTATVDFGGGKKTKVKPALIALEVMSMPMPQAPNTITYAPRFSVDLATAQATWTDAKGNTQTSGGPVTDKDLLAYFAEYNVDTTRQDVMDEAGELVAMIDGLIAGQNKFTVQYFEGGGYSSGSSSRVGPLWFLPVYIGAWFLIWIALMVFLAKRAKRVNAARPPV